MIQQVIDSGYHGFLEEFGYCISIHAGPREGVLEITTQDGLILSIYNSPHESFGEDSCTICDAHDGCYTNLLEDGKYIEGNWRKIVDLAYYGVVPTTPKTLFRKVCIWFMFMIDKII